MTIKKQALEKFNNDEKLLKPAKEGEIVQGIIISKGRSSVFLDLGSWGTGIIYGKEFFEAKDKLKKLKNGDTIFAKIIDLENEDGYIELSLTKAGKEIAWENLKQKKEQNETLMVKIKGANKGGLLTEVSGIPAFLPSSQLSTEHYPKIEGGDNRRILSSLQKLIGKEIKVKIFDLDPKEEKLILSEKAGESEKVKELLKNYKVGDVVEGEITGVVDFGAFLKFPVQPHPSKKTETEQSPPNYLEGLIHISELDWQLIEDPTEIVKVGDKLKAKIIKISDHKIFLSLKALKENPWQAIEEKYKKGDIVSGKATKFNSFGAFVQLINPETGKSTKIQGLCHISEFGSQKKMEETLKIGEKYNFQILSINPKEYRIGLKLKQ